MNKFYLTLATAFSVIVLLGCAQPAKLLNQSSSAPIGAKKIESLVVSIKPSIYSNGRYVNSRLIIDSIKDELKKSFSGNNIPIEIVEESGVELNASALQSAMKIIKPTHYLELQTTSGSTMQGSLVGVVWQVNLSQKRALTDNEKSKMPALSADAAFIYAPIYKAVLSANSCAVMASSNDSFRTGCVQKLTTPLKQALTDSGF
jgi:hypothetical protein